MQGVSFSVQPSFQAAVISIGHNQHMSKTILIRSNIEFFSLILAQGVRRLLNNLHRKRAFTYALRYNQQVFPKLPWEACADKIATGVFIHASKGLQ